MARTLTIGETEIDALNVAQLFEGLQPHPLAEELYLTLLAATGKPGEEQITAANRTLDEIETTGYWRRPGLMEHARRLIAEIADCGDMWVRNCRDGDSNREGYYTLHNRAQRLARGWPVAGG